MQKLRTQSMSGPDKIGSWNILCPWVHLSSPPG